MSYWHDVIGGGNTVLCACGVQYKENAAYQSDKSTVALPSPSQLFDGVQFSGSWGNHTQSWKSIVQQHT